jgi:hypothetical protein
MVLIGKGKARMWRMQRRRREEEEEKKIRRRRIARRMKIRKRRSKYCYNEHKEMCQA